MNRSAIGVDIGGTNIRAARVDGKGAIAAHAHAASSRNPAEVIERVEALIAKMDDSSVQGIGIGIPGQVDFAGQRVLSGGYVDLSGLPVHERIETRFGRRVVLDNDANMALLAEVRCGAAVRHRNVTMLTIGTGIGGAIVADGRIFRGAGTAGQLGHVIVDPLGRPCKCGRRGCIETVSSGTALGTHIAEAGLPMETTAVELLSRRNEGDALAARVLDAWALPLRTAISSLATTLAPEIIILGGGLGAAAAAAVADYPDPSTWFSYEIAAAQLGDDAGVIGAALASLAPAAGQGKRLVLVNGVPASGKSRVAASLSSATGWPILSLDTIKNPFLEEIGNVDRPFNRKLGRASLRAMFSILRDAPAGTTAIMDAWFGFQPQDFVQGLVEEAGVDATAEIWCTAPPDIIGARYGARAASRLPGHPGLEYVAELVALASRAEPSRFGPVHPVDTTEPLDIEAVRRFLDHALGV